MPQIVVSYDDGMTDKADRHFVIDNNFAQREAMREYLSASPHNIAVMTEAVMVEWHKRNAANTTRRGFEFMCEFPNQVLILKGTATLVKMNGSTSGLKHRLIDHKQTRHLAAYCRLNIKTPLDSALAAAYAELEAQARDQTTELATEGSKMFSSFNRLSETLSKLEANELRQLKDNKTALSGDLQRKTCTWAFGHAATMHKAYGLRLPLTFNHFVNTLSFRYAAMMLGLFLVWQEHKGTAPSNPKKLLNHVMDLKIAAQATYFDGLKTFESDLARSFEHASAFLHALNAYSHCGKRGSTKAQATILPS